VERLKIYIDEDAMDSDLVAALRSRGVVVMTALDSGLIENSDEAQLAFATLHGSSLYTFNVCDFYRIHTEWINDGRDHVGLYLLLNRDFPLASNSAESCVFVLRELLRACAVKSSSLETGGRDVTGAKGRHRRRGRHPCAIHPVKRRVSSRVRSTSVRWIFQPSLAQA
jgi:hypothetical protein